MKRRVLLKLFSLLTTLPFSRIINASQDSGEDPLEFFVAGVRFQEPVSVPLKVGDRISVCAESFKGLTAYSIYTSKTQRIGFVPKSLVPTLSGQKQYIGIIVSANRFAVPWKRYRVKMIKI